MKCIIIIITVLCAQATIAQLDSLKFSRLEKEKGIGFVGKGKFLTATERYKKALRYLPENNLEKKAELFFLLNQAYASARAYDSASSYTKRIKQLQTVRNTPYIRCLFYRSKAKVLIAKNKIDSTMFYTLKAHALAEEINDKALLKKTNFELGIIFYRELNAKKAHYYLDEAERYAKMLNDSVELAYIWSQRAAVLLNQDSIDVAEQELKRAYKYFKRTNNSLGIIVAIGNLSKVYFARGQYQRATETSFELEAHLKELEYTNDLKKLITNTTKIIELESKDSITDREKMATLKQLIDKNMNITKGTQMTVEQNKGLVKYFRENKLPDSLKLYSIEELNDKLNTAFEIQDSIYRSSLEGQYKELETKYQTQKKEKENLQLKQENTQKQLDIEKESKRKWLFAIGLITSVLALGIFLYYYRKNQRQKRVIEGLQRELHHRVKNNLSIIDAFIDTTKAEFSDIILQKRLLELQHRIESMAEVHEQLYMSEQVHTLDINAYLTTLTDSIQATQQRPEVSLIRNVDKNIAIPTEQSFPIGLIVNEFVTNSYKHAFPDKRKGTINVSLSETKKAFELHLSDNGIGLPDDFDIDHLDSFGMEVIKLLSKQLKGSFSLQGTAGVTIDINIPKSA